VIESVWVPKAKVVEALEFAEGFIANGKSGKDFGNTSIVRNDKVRLSDSALGSIGETAFSIAASRYGLDIQGDQTLRYGNDCGDYGQDIRKISVCGEPRFLLPKLDVKTTKKGNGWLLVERHRLQASIFVLVHADIPREAKSNPDLLLGDIECQVIGFALITDFMGDDGHPLFQFKQGQSLIKPSIAMEVLSNARAPNRKELRRAWTEKTVHPLNSIDPYMNVQLSCPDQCGLPNQILRTDAEYLFNIMKGMSVKEERVDASTVSAK